MTFLYLPSIERIDLSRNSISFIYKFAFYRMCSPNVAGGRHGGEGDDDVTTTTTTGSSQRRRKIAVSLRRNRLRSDSVWKVLTTFEHLETTDCLIDIDMSYNQVI